MTELAIFIGSLGVMAWVIALTAKSKKHKRHNPRYHKADYK